MYFIPFSSKDDMFPTEGTPDALFDGIRFNDLPIVHIKSTPNNTIINVTSATHDLITYRSCGMEGFKNTRKGTNIAAQATAITVGGVSKY
jgi:small subunit ribosomal protein S11